MNSDNMDFKSDEKDKMIEKYLLLGEQQRQLQAHVYEIRHARRAMEASVMEYVESQPKEGLAIDDPAHQLGGNGALKVKHMIKPEILNAESIARCAIEFVDYLVPDASDDDKIANGLMMAAWIWNRRQKISRKCVDRVYFDKNDKFRYKVVRPIDDETMKRKRDEDLRADQGPKKRLSLSTVSLPKTREEFMEIELFRKLMHKWEHGTEHETGQDEMQADNSDQSECD